MSVENVHHSSFLLMVRIGNSLPERDSECLSNSIF